MTNVDNSITSKQLTTLTLIGLSILILFASGFFWIGYNGGVDVFLVFAPFGIFLYLIVISVYIGFFAAKFARGKWKHSWLWGIGGSILTILLIIGLPILLSPMFPDQGIAIFALLAFFAPILSALLIMLLISVRRKATV